MLNHLFNVVISGSIADVGFVFKSLDMIIDFSTTYPYAFKAYFAFRLKDQTRSNQGVHRNW